MHLLKKILMGTTILCLAVLAALYFYARHLEHNNIFYPTKEILHTPKDLGLDFEDVYFETNDHVKLNAWFVPNSQAQGTLLFFHGNGSNNGNRIDTINFYHSLGLNVFIVDYRGYGNSQGHPSEKGIYQDALASYDYLVNVKKIDPRKIISYGASLGGAPAIDLASKRPLGGLIVDSSFSSAVDMAKLLYPIVPSFLVSVKLDSINKVKDLKIPKLFIHSVNDEMIPYAIGRKLFEAAAEPKIFVNVHSKHNQDRESEDEQNVKNAIIKFLRLIQ